MTTEEKKPRAKHPMTDPERHWRRSILKRFRSIKGLDLGKGIICDPLRGGFKVKVLLSSQAGYANARKEFGEIAEKIELRTPQYAPGRPKGATYVAAIFRYGTVGA